ncbi:MAG: lysylphosphatidylglycerol synthase transmembrane domain-containing protein [Dehalococcoidia bacterium]
MSLPRAGEQHASHGEQEDNAPLRQAWLRWRFILALPVAALSAWWLWLVADPEAVLPVLRSAHAEIVLAASLLVVASLLAKTIRWRMLLGSGALSVTEAYRIFHISVLMNNLLPLRAGDGARVVSTPVRRGSGARRAVVALVGERLIDGVALGAIAASGAVAVALWPEWASMAAVGRVLVVLASGVGLGAALAGVALVRSHGLGAPGRPGWTTRLGQRLEEWGAAVRLDRGTSMRVVGLTAASWLGTLWLHYVLLGAVGTSQSLELAVAVTLTTNLALLVPAAPAGIGTVHAAAAAPLVASGVSTEVALGFAILVHAVNVVPPSLIGLACLVPWRTPRWVARQA